MNLRRRIRTVQVFLRQRQQSLDFSGIPDPRDPRGRRWSLDGLLSAALLSLMLLARSLRAAERLSEDLAQSQRRRGLGRRVPDSTLGDLLAKLEPEALRRHLHEQVLGEHRRKALEPEVLPLRAISIDGKMVASLDAAANADCQRQQAEGQPPHWLYRVVRATLISATAAACIDQRPIPAATNDMGVFSSFFADLERAYRRASLYELVSCDAGFCSEANARQVDEAGKGYVFGLKGNQPELLGEARRVLGEQARLKAPEAETDWESDSSRGWVKRQIWRTAELAGWSAWSHLRQVWLLRVLQRDGKGGTERLLEERFYVTNLVWGRLKGGAILDLIRAHWRIENDCFGSLDIQWQEDHGRWVRRRNGLEVSSLLRLLAYNLLALLRASHLRSLQARRSVWQQLRDWVRDALLWPSLIDQPEAEPEALPAGT